MLPKHSRETGALRRMSMAQSRVYIAMVLRANWKQGGRVIVRQAETADDPSNSLEADTGLTPRTIRISDYLTGKRDVNAETLRKMLEALKLDIRPKRNRRKGR